MSKHADEHVQRWYASGHLYKCPNPPHAFKFWRVVGEWQIASNSWSYVTSVGTLHTQAFSFHTVRTHSGVKGYVLNVWRFALRFAFKDSTV